MTSASTAAASALDAGVQISYDPAKVTELKNRVARVRELCAAAPAVDGMVRPGEILAILDGEN